MVLEIKIQLTEAAIGEPYRLESLEGGRSFQRRLAELGLTPGVCLRVLQDCGGPLLIAIRNSRIALGRGMANKITVTPLKTGGRSPDAIKAKHSSDQVKDAQS